ncbi:MAG: sugar phosphate isomerase/epimerase, partial [Armatimonadota bacterium]|nr:sugar phosphate isomerase/epimerase [Armatimonadota bacterium]
DVLGHVHLADNTRKEPGSGFTDFRSSFKVLKEVGYTGYMALECGLTGPAAEVLPRAAAYLRRCME